MRGLAPAGAALLAGCLAGPVAAQPVPERLCPHSYEIRIARPTIVRAEARVTCQVERDARLAQRVAAEARQAVNRAVGIAEAQTRGKAPAEREEHAFAWTTEAVHATARTLSLLTTLREGVGAAPERVTPRTLAWDLDRGLYITLNELFREPRPGGPAMTALRDAVRAALRPELGADAAALDALKAEPASFRHWTLAPGADPERAGGINVHYPAGALAPRALTAFVPTEALVPHLAPGRRDLFGPPRAP